MFIGKRGLCLIGSLVVAGCDATADTPDPLPPEPVGGQHGGFVEPPPPPTDVVTPGLPPSVCVGGGVAGGASAGFAGMAVSFDPILLPTVSAAKAPPPISGGTLLASRDGKLVIASDPDRDRVYFVDAQTESLLFTRELKAGDEPGRLTEDAEGRVHVALRGAGALATLTRQPTDPIVRRPLCDLPRGLAYDAAQDTLHVACAEGKLVTLPAAPSGSVTRTLELGGDVRDVVVRGSQLFVSRFRSAELLSVAADGSVMVRSAPPTLTQTEIDFVVDESSCGRERRQEVASSANVAWRMLDVPNAGIAMLHQRSREAEVQVTSGGYGGSSGCAPGITHTAITLGTETNQQRSADIGSLTLAVDIATDPDGVLLAAVAPANYGSGISQVEIYRLLDSQSWLLASPGSSPDERAVLQDSAACASPSISVNDVSGQATAVAFSSPYILAVQEREPAGIAFIDVRTGAQRSHLDLKQESRFDTGHALFHARTGAGLACASCHAEAGDDSHTWTFHGIGARRTQQLRGGILGTEPFHWNGDMSDFPMLVKEVFVGRMQGAALGPDKTAALATWIDRQPGYKLSAADPAAAERGKLLFNSAAVGCNECHAGAELTNSQTVDVGTGAALQVPSLHNVALRSPLMHDGCAKTLRDRFTQPACGGGDKHGRVSQLTAAQLDDLIMYVGTL